MEFACSEESVRPGRPFGPDADGRLSAYVALSAGHVEDRILQLQSEKADEGEAIAKSV